MTDPRNEMMFNFFEFTTPHSRRTSHCLRDKRLLRTLKVCLIDLVAHHVLPWEIVAAVFRLIPELKGA